MCGSYDAFQEGSATPVLTNRQRSRCSRVRLHRERGPRGFGAVEFRHVATVPNETFAAPVRVARPPGETHRSPGGDCPGALFAFATPTLRRGTSRWATVNLRIRYVPTLRDAAPV